MPATDTQVISQQSIAAISPMEAAGTVDVSVTNAYGTTDITPQDQFVFAAIPNVSAVSPPTGSITVPRKSTISGTGLAYASSVDFVDSYGDSFPGTIVSDSDNQLVVTSPDNPTGNYNGVNLLTYDIVVTTPGGTSATGTPDQFTFMPAPAIGAVSPPSRSVYGGTQVTITGTGLVGFSSVLFGGNPATIVSNTDYQGTDTLVVINPESTGDAEQYVNVSVTTPYGTSTVAYGYGYYLPPTVTGLSQSSGPLGGGTWLTITGTNLENAPAVDFGPNVAIPNYYFTNDTQIQLFVPAAARHGRRPGVGSGGPVARYAGRPVHLRGGARRYERQPQCQPGRRRTSVTVYGTGLDNASSVVFNDGQGDVFPAAIVTGSNTDNQIVVTSPDAYSGTCRHHRDHQRRHFVHVAGGPVHLRGVAGGLRPSFQLRASARRRPGDDHRHESRQRHGGRLRQRPGGRLHGQREQIDHATTPAGSDGIVDATVVTPGGTSPTSSANEFAYIQPQPVIDGVSPSAGVVGGGSQVTITAPIWITPRWSISPTARAMFTRARLSPIRQHNSSSPAPRGFGHRRPDRDNHWRTSAVNPADQFTYVAGPAVTSIGTPLGPVSGGKSVFLYGTDLGARHGGRLRFQFGHDP